MAQGMAMFQLVERGTKLCLALYEQCGTFTSAPKEFRKLAKGVNLFLLVYRQADAAFKEDRSIPSIEAFRIVEHIFSRSQHIFSELELVVPLNTLASGFEMKAVQSSYQPGFNEKLLCHLRYLDFLRLTLNVMLQTFYTAKVLQWSKQQQTTLSREAVCTERLQTECLIIEQQVCWLKAQKLLVGYREHSTFSGFDPISSSEWLNALPSNEPANTGRSGSQELRRDLIDIDGVQAVRSTGGRCVDNLLKRWTTLAQTSVIEGASPVDTSSLVLTQNPESVKAKVPNVTDDEHALDGVLSVADNALIEHPQPQSYRGKPRVSDMDLPSAHVESVEGTRFGRDARHSPSTAGQEGSFPVTPPARSSPPSHFQKSNSFSGTSSTISTKSLSPMEKQNSTGPNHKTTGRGPALGIPWRICTPTAYWEFLDGNLVGSNSKNDPFGASSDRNAWTEILESWVYRQAIEEAGYNFTQVQKERSDGRSTKFEPCFCIYNRLAFPQIERLVERTVELFRQYQARSTPPSKVDPARPVLERADTSSTGSNHPQLGRSQSLPTRSIYYPTPHTQLPPPGPYSQSQPRHQDQISSNSQQRPRVSFSEKRRSNTYVAHSEDSDTDGSSRRRRSSSHSRKSRDGGSRRSSGSSTLGQIAAGAGIATLLDGLAEGLSAL